MAGFMIRFLLCNILLCGIIGILLLVKHIFKDSLSSRMQYNLWFLLLGILAVPFLPFRFFRLPQMLLILKNLYLSSVSKPGAAIGQTGNADYTDSQNWMETFTLSVPHETSSLVGYVLFFIWILGIIAMVIFVIRSALCLHTLKKSALPLQSPKVRRLYKHCLSEARIAKEIPIYSTAFLKSPVIAGLFRPCIYLPIHLISDAYDTDIRYMLLHELQHYKHKDGMVNYLMNLAGIIYWFHPLVLYSLKEMRNDQEIACDTSVLKILDSDDYVNYGNTLISFAKKMSLTPFPFASGMSGNMKQMRRGIINIASYEKPTFQKKLKSITIFLLTSVLLFCLAPFVSAYAADEDYYPWNISSKTCTAIDLTRYFGNYEGSFVLYDSTNDTWKIHNMELAALRVAPNSTYKIYNALFGLENNIITSENTFVEWDGTAYPFETWNADQTLPSAMSSSVNWYFQWIDEQLGAASIENYLHKIRYGNENLGDNFSSYWMESSLKISPIEQVELLSKLQKNSLGFSPENISAVKNSIHIASSAKGNLYGKTGTGRINEQDVNGWFIGCIEHADNTYFFATNIHAKEHADGRNAAEITLSVLSDMSIWE